MSFDITQCHYRTVPKLSQTAAYGALAGTAGSAAAFVAQERERKSGSPLMSPPTTAHGGSWSAMWTASLCKREVRRVETYYSANELTGAASSFDAAHEPVAERVSKSSSENGVKAGTGGVR